MPNKPNRVFTREFKEATVRRLLAGETVAALAQELGLWRKSLYDWRERYEAGGVEALRGTGRPRRSRSTMPSSAGAPADRVAELERKIGQQAVELDFFARALRHIEASARPNDGPGATTSSP